MTDIIAWALMAGGTLVLLVVALVLIWQAVTGVLAFVEAGRRPQHCQRPCCRYSGPTHRHR